MYPLEQSLRKNLKSETGSETLIFYAWAIPRHPITPSINILRRGKRKREESMRARAHIWMSEGESSGLLTERRTRWE